MPRVFLEITYSFNYIESMKDRNFSRINNAHEYWSYKGLIVDLVVFNEDESIYYQPLFENIREVLYENREIL